MSKTVQITVVGQGKMANMIKLGPEILKIGPVAQVRNAEDFRAVTLLDFYDAEKYFVVHAGTG